MDRDDPSTAGNTPEDVAVLYSWANLQGAKYRDYSASRREYRAQIRYRAAKALLDQELQTQTHEDGSAAQADQAARADDIAARSTGSRISPRSGASIQAKDSKKEAAVERVEAAQRAEAAARLTVLALREEREIAEAHSSARRQALAYDEAEQQRRQLAGPQPFAAPAEPNTSGELNTDAARLDVGFEARWATNPQQLSIPGWQDLARPMPAEDLICLDSYPESGWLPDLSAQITTSSPTEFHEGELFEESGAPAWFFASQAGVRAQTGSAAAPGGRVDQVAAETLLQSRQQVAARWSALRGAFEYAAPARTALPQAQPGRTDVPLTILFSLAGGVGKTSLAATLAHALAARGETVAVADTTSHGLLPVYFRERGFRSRDFGSRGFATREASTDDHSARAPAKVTGAPVSLAVHDFADGLESEFEREAAVQALIEGGRARQRLLLDVATGAAWLVRRLVDLQPVVLVPVAPDINSVISLQAVERLFQGMVSSDGRRLLPYYVLNQFDASLPLHLDIREVFRRQLGDRLLRVAIRRSQSVSEALADGMTVLDYAPDAPVAGDYLEIANWLRGVAPPATGEVPSVPWGGP